MNDLTDLPGIIYTVLGPVEDVCQFCSDYQEQLCTYLVLLIATYVLCRRF